MSEEFIVKVQSSVYPTGNLLIYNEDESLHLELYGGTDDMTIVKFYEDFPTLKVRGTKLYTYASVDEELQLNVQADRVIPEADWPNW